ncbi:secG, partial [Symbiodinium microadriaticum]
WTPLHKAAYKGHAVCVDLLLKVGAEKEATEMFGQTPLHEAACNGRADRVDLLLKAGAEKDSQDNFGYTALDSAKLQHHEACISPLEKVGAASPGFEGLLGALSHISATMRARVPGS